MNENFIVSDAKDEDLVHIVSIYNWAINNTVATFDTKEKTVESQRQWFDSRDDKHPIIVIRDGSVVAGWGAIGEWSDKCAYTKTGEISFYIHPSYHGKGMGTQVLKELISIARRMGYRTLISKITTKSDVSIHLHKKLGFEHIGTMKNVGEKFDEILHVHLMQILF